MNDVLAVLERGLHAAREQSQAQRLAERGTMDKANPYITDAGKECDRAVVYSLLNVPESDPPDTHSLINFAVGHAFEEAIAGMLEAQGLSVLREVRVEIPVDGTVVSGRADFLIVAPDAIWELKSVGGWAFKANRKEGGNAAHKRQLNQYVHAANLGLIEGIGAVDHGVLVYLRKDAVRGDDALAAYEVPYDAGKAQRDLDRLASLAAKARAEELPERPFDKPVKWPCLYCPYLTTCFKEAK